jgi:hypothetical protein
MVIYMTNLVLQITYTYNCLPKPIANIAAVSAIVKAKKIWLSVIMKSNIKFIYYVIVLLFI